MNSTPNIGSNSQCQDQESHALQIKSAKHLESFLSEAESSRKEDSKSQIAVTAPYLYFD